MSIKLNTERINETVNDIVSTVNFLCKNDLSFLELDKKLEVLNEKMDILQTLIFYSNDEKFTINDIAKKVTFVSLEIFVEGYSAFVSNIESIGDNKQDILSIDVGGGTTDICSFSYDYDDEIYYPNDTLTITKGVIDYGLEIAKHFNELENADISSKYIDSLLRNNIEEIEYKGNKYKLGNYLSSIEPIVYDTTNKITNKFGELDRYIVVGIGGGYKTYNHMIKDRIASEIILDEDSQFFGNAEGYLEQ